MRKAYTAAYVFVKHYVRRPQRPPSFGRKTPVTAAEYCYYRSPHADSDMHRSGIIGDKKMAFGKCGVVENIDFFEVESIQIYRHWIVEIVFSHME